MVSWYTDKLFQAPLIFFLAYHLTILQFSSISTGLWEKSVPGQFDCLKAM